MAPRHSLYRVMNESQVKRLRQLGYQIVPIDQPAGAPAEALSLPEPNPVDSAEQAALDVDRGVQIAEHVASGFETRLKTEDEERIVEALARYFRFGEVPDGLEFEAPDAEDGAEGAEDDGTTKPTARRRRRASGRGKAS